MINNKLKIVGLLSVILVVAGCGKQKTDEKEHYFLKGYDHLEFRDTTGVAVGPERFIQGVQRNSRRIYIIRDTTLTLVDKRSGEAYNGYIKTFQRDRYNLNLQGEFEDGKIFRLRYWHPNRTLGMDVDYRDRSLTVWNSAGNVAIEGNAAELYYYYPGRNAIKEIISDTMHSQFDTEGNLVRYTIYRDTATLLFDGAGLKLREFPYMDGVGAHGLYKEWYQNGQVKVSGRYKEGEQVGTWIEYDSLGNEINREVFEP